MNDGHPTGASGDRSRRAECNGNAGRKPQNAVVGSLPGRSGLSDACIMRRGNARIFCTYFTVAYFRTLKRPPQTFRPGNPPVT
jgi:hypothetical protein